MTLRLILWLALTMVAIGTFLLDYLGKNLSRRAKYTILAVLLIGLGVSSAGSLQSIISDANASRLAQANQERSESKIDSLRGSAKDVGESLAATSALLHAVGMQTDIRALEGKVQVAGLQQEVEHLRTTLMPFAELASISYPGMSSDLALRRLAADLEGIKTTALRSESTAIAVRDRDVYKELDAELTVQLVAGLQSAFPKTEEGPYVRVAWVVTGAEREALASELLHLLKRAGVRSDTSYSAVGNGYASPLDPFFLTFRTGEEELARKFATALAPLFPIALRCYDDAHSQSRVIYFHLQGDPYFSSRGQVTFRGQAQRNPGR